MFVPEELKVNRFSDVHIPSNKDYFARLGSQQLPIGQYTGDDAAPMPMNKVDQLSEAEQQILDDAVHDMTGE